MLPLLVPMSEVAGRMSVQVGATYLQSGLGGSWHRQVGHQLRGQGHRLIYDEGPVAFQAFGSAVSVLHQPAEVAAHYFACIHAQRGGSHGLSAEGQSCFSGVPFRTTIGATIGEMNHNCQVET